eukprot:TRINITY_DN46199_c0_g1_i1.p1 TRINITY_DN46199_c0_g1~~TRINITY_DN46199_c0_g1_i1.p1  ORF type:complete len:348 (+),score=69.57 TRINITY_DN46199_c0_g1_i1:104-1147(+)
MSKPLRALLLVGFATFWLTVPPGDQGFCGGRAAAGALSSLGISRTARAAAGNAAATKFKIGLCQTDVSDDKAVSLQNVRRAVADAVQRGADLVVLGEMFCCPFSLDNFPRYGERVPGRGESASAEHGDAGRLLGELAKQHQVWLVGGSVPEIADDGRIYNTCMVVDPTGRVAARHRKVHLFDVEVAATDSRPGISFKESDRLGAGQELTVVDLPWCRAGIGICYDVRFAEYALAMRDRGAELLLFPSAFSFPTGEAHWTTLARGRALDTQCYVAMASPARSKDPNHYKAWGHSMLVNPWAEVLVEADENEGVYVAEVDLQKVDSVRRQIPTSWQKRDDLYVPYARRG